MSDTRAVYVDLDDTLVGYDRSFDAIFRAALDAHGVDYRPAMFETYQNAFFGYFEALAPEPYRAAVGDVVDRFDLEVEPGMLTETYLEREVAATTVDDATRAVLDRIAANHPVGVVTNGVASVQRRKLAHHGLDGFDAVVISYEVGAHKPDPAFFAAAKAAVDADRYTLVGDHLDEDITPAREAGFETVYVRGDGDGPDVEVRDFDALAALFELV